MRDLVVGYDVIVNGLGGNVKDKGQNLLVMPIYIKRYNKIYIYPPKRLKHLVINA